MLNKPFIQHDENIHTLTDNGNLQLLIKAHPRCCSRLIIIFY